MRGVCHSTRIYCPVATHQSLHLITMQTKLQCFMKRFIPDCWQYWEIRSNIGEQNSNINIFKQKLKPNFTDRGAEMHKINSFNSARKLNKLCWMFIFRSIFPSWSFISFRDLEFKKLQIRLMVNKIIPVAVETSLTAAPIDLKTRS